MPALKNIFLSVLLLTVASRVKGNITTVTLFDVAGGPVGTAAASPKVIDVSAIAVEPNGGTQYVGGAVVTMTPFEGPPVTTTQDATFVEAASWLYVSVQRVSEDIIGSLEGNCTLGADGTTAECIDILDVAEAGVAPITTTTTVAGRVVPIYTLTVTGPIPTKSSAATILDNPIFNRLPSFFGGILFIMTFF